MRMNDKKEKTIETALQDLFIGCAENTIFENCETETFEDAEILTSDKGIIIYLESGEKIHLTIQAYE